MTLTPRSLLTTFIALVPAAAALLVYSDAVNHDFLRWDDYAYIVENDFVHGLGLASLKFAFIEYYFHNWHPLTWLAFMVQYQLWGENALLFKAVNVGFHIVNSYLIALLAYKITLILYPASPKAADNEYRQRWLASLFAGAFFAVHPLHVESVVWISELKDVLSGMFYFAALIAYINFRQSDNDLRWRNLVGVFFLCALMSKSMAVTLPAVLIVLDVFLFKRLQRDSWISGLTLLIREKLLYFVVSACVVALTFLSQNTESLESTNLLTRLINAVESPSLYIGRFVFPANLSPVYPFSSMSLDPGLHSLVPVAILAAVIIALLALEKYAFKGVILALVFFLVAILPVIGFIKVGAQASADRYTYIPMAMFFIAAACGMFRLLNAARLDNKLKSLGLGLTLAALCGYAWQTIAYVPVWQTDEKLWSHVNQQYPMRVVAAYINLGNIEHRKGNNDAALQLYESALAIDSDNINALGNRAAINENIGNKEKASSLYQQLAEVRGDSVLAQNMAAIGMRRLGNMELSAQYYHRALELAPTSQLQLYESALADHLIGNNDSASNKVSILLQLNNQHRQGRILKVALLFNQGLPQQANLQLEALRNEFPNDPQIAQIYQQLKNQPAQ